MYHQPYEYFTTDLFIISGGKRQQNIRHQEPLTARTVFCRLISRLSRNTASKIDRVSLTSKSVNENTKRVLDMFLLIP